MPKYLFIGQYTAEGARGVIKDGGTKRREAAETVASSLGGTVESMYFGFGDDDFYVVADLPDNSAAAALSMTVGASGALGIRTVALLTTDEVDAAAKRSVDYTPPGS